MKQFIFVISALLILFGCTKREIVFDNQINESFEIPTLFQINGIECAFDAPSKTLRYSASASELISFNPLIKFQNHSEVIFLNEELVNNSRNSLGTLEINKKYPINFVTQGTTTRLYLEFTEIAIVIFSTLDDVHNEEKILGKMNVNYPNGVFPNLSTFIGIEHRGKSSLGLPKKSYGIKPLASANPDDLKKISFFGFRPNEKWSFDAMYNDKSKIRNKLSYEVWKSLNQTSIESNYVEVFLNNRSKGLYRLGEVYSQTKLNLLNESILYKGIDNSKYTKFLSHSSRQPRSAVWADWEQEYPDPSQVISWDEFHDLSKLIGQESNSEFISQIGKKLNLDQVIDYYLFVQLAYARDNAGKNWFFLKNRISDKFEILLWDVDASWGREENGYPVSSNLMVQNNLFERLLTLNPDNFRIRLKQRWSDFRRNQLSGSTLNSLIATHLNELENLQVISEDNAIWGQNTNLETEKSYLNTWLTDRIDYLDNYFSNL